MPVFVSINCILIKVIVVVVAATAVVIVTFFVGSYGINFWNYIEP